MKKKSGYLFAVAVIGFTFFSCVKEGYDWNKVDKEMAFSHEHGLSFQLGQLNKIEIPETAIPKEIYDLIDPDPVNADIPPETYTGIFTKEMYDYFIYDNNGKDEPLGDIILEADLEMKMSDVEANKISNIQIDLHIVDKDSRDIGIAIDPKILDPKVSEHNFDIIIRKEDVMKLKNADGLQFAINFSAANVTKGDYVQLRNIWLKLTGGISFTL
jgi:hypothetical protein